MNLSANLREKFFWSFDKITSGKVNQAYQELKMLDGLDSASKVLADHQSEALQRLFQHTIKTTDYYSEIAKTEAQLNDFPVVNKNLIRENQGFFLSKAFSKSKLFKMLTSGSTGAPFTCYQDERKKKRVNAEVIYYNEKVGYKVGKKIIVLRAVIDQNRKSKFDQWIQNIIQIDISQMDDRRIEDLLAEISVISTKGSLILAYASTYDVLSDYFKRKGVMDNFNIFGLVSISEILSDETRASMVKAFKCKCVSRYSNQENGILGQDNLVNNAFILNEANYIFETLRFDSGLPAESGEIGRIVVTDLYNYAMPLIRYDTGDIGAITTLENNGVIKRVITKFGGRKIDMIYDAEGNYLSPHKISVTFWQYAELKQFQFVQKGVKKYLVRLNPHGSFEKQKELEIKLMNILGKSAELKFEYTNEIPVLDSGKRKYIQNDAFEG